METFRACSILCSAPRTPICYLALAAGTLALAKAACMLHASCSGVLSKGCRQGVLSKGKPFYLCKLGVRPVALITYSQLN